MVLPLQKTLPFLGVGGLVRQGDPEVKMRFYVLLVAKEEREEGRTFAPLAPGTFPSRWTMANPRPDAHSPVLAGGEAHSLAKL